MISRTPIFPAAIVLAALAGCSLTPDYQRPDAPIPSGWRDQSGSTEPNPWPSADWWRGFNSPTLDTLVVTAQRSNKDLAIAAARVLQADAQARISGAPLLPAIDATASADRTKSSSNSSSSSSSSGRISDSLSVGLSASYEIDFWGKNRAALAAAEETALASRFDRATVALTVTSNVAATYFQVLQFRDRLAVARENLENAERVLAVVEARVSNGAASPLDLAQQRTQVANQRATIPPLETQARQAENALAILLGANPGGASLGDGGLAGILPPPVAAGLPSELLLRRPDVQTAEAQLRAANADIGTTRAALFPSIDLTGQYGFKSAVLSSLFDPASTFWSLGAGLTQAVFQGGRLTGQVDFARARYEELAQTYLKSVIAAFADVENALVATQRSAEQETLQLDAVEQARLAHQFAEARYREGATDLLVLLDAQRALFQAEDQFVQVRFQRLQAIVSLYKALGGGWMGTSASAG